MFFFSARIQFNMRCSCSCYICFRSLFRACCVFFILVLCTRCLVCCDFLSLSSSSSTCFLCHFAIILFKCVCLAGWLAGWLADWLMLPHLVWLTCYFNFFFLFLSVVVLLPSSNKLKHNHLNHFILKIRLTRSHISGFPVCFVVFAHVDFFPISLSCCGSPLFLLSVTGLCIFFFVLQSCCELQCQIKTEKMKQNTNQTFKFTHRVKKMRCEREREKKKKERLEVNILICVFLYLFASLAGFRFNQISCCGAVLFCMCVCIFFFFVS